MKILVACEESQAITKELRSLGHNAFSCDLLPCSGGHPEWHFNFDVFEIIENSKIGMYIINTYFKFWRFTAATYRTSRFSNSTYRKAHAGSKHPYAWVYGQK